MWNKPRPEKDDSLAAKVVRYRRRPARYADAALAKRREEFREAVATTRHDGDPPLSAIEAELGELWATGRVSRAEYLDLCAAYVGEPADQ